MFVSCDGLSGHVLGSQCMVEEWIHEDAWCLAAHCVARDLPEKTESGLWHIAHGAPRQVVDLRDGVGGKQVDFFSLGC